MSLTKAMQYEDVPLHSASKSAVKKEVKRLRETDINKMSSLQILWHLAVKHKFGLLVTFTVSYVTFSLFGTLIVGLLKGL